MNEQKLIAAIQRNAREEIRVTLGQWNGSPGFGMRAWFKASDDTTRPSKDGVTLRAALLPDPARALADAERQARSDRRQSKLPCRAPAMHGKPVCRLHGGKGGGPKGERNGAYRTGRYTAEATAERRATRALMRDLRRLIDADD